MLRSAAQKQAAEPSPAPAESPCQSGRNARFASSFEVGTHVQIWGRIQSREYVKKISDTEVEQRVAYEVSVSKIEV